MSRLLHVLTMVPDVQDTLARAATSHNHFLYNAGCNDRRDVRATEGLVRRSPRDVTMTRGIQGNSSRKETVVKETVSSIHIAFNRPTSW